jgi:hypothetical protein
MYVSLPIPAPLLPPSPAIVDFVTTFGAANVPEFTKSIVGTSTAALDLTMAEFEPGSAKLTTDNAASARIWLQRQFYPLDSSKLGMELGYRAQTNSQQVIDFRHTLTRDEIPHQFFIRLTYDVATVITVEYQDSAGAWQLIDNAHKHTGGFLPLKLIVDNSGPTPVYDTLIINSVPFPLGGVAPKTLIAAVGAQDQINAEFGIMTQIAVVKTMNCGHYILTHAEA